MAILTNDELAEKVVLYLSVYKRATPTQLGKELKIHHYRLRVVLDSLKKNKLVLEAVRAKRWSYIISNEPTTNK